MVSFHDTWITIALLHSIDTNTDHSFQFSGLVVIVVILQWDVVIHNW